MYEYVLLKRINLVSSSLWMVCQIIKRIHEYIFLIYRYFRLRKQSLLHVFVFCRGISNAICNLKSSAQYFGKTEEINQS